MDVSTGIALAVGLSLFFALCYALGINERVHRTLTCPHEGAQAEVDVVQRYGKPGRSVRVASCSLLPRPSHVDCDEACLKGAK